MKVDTKPFHYNSGFKHSVEYLSSKGIECNVITSQKIITFTHNGREYKYVPTKNKWQSRRIDGKAYKGKWPWKRINGKIYTRWYQSDTVEQFYDTYVSKEPPKNENTN